MNQNEESVKSELESARFRVLRNGWPDFLCVRDDGVCAVEVKTAQDKLSMAQQENHTVLGGLGLPIHIVEPRSRTKTPRSFQTVRGRTPRQMDYLEEIGIEQTKAINRLFRLVCAYRKLISSMTVLGRIDEKERWALETLSGAIERELSVADIKTPLGIYRAACGGVLHTSAFL